MNITPNNPLLRIYRGGKRAQRTILSTMRMASESENVGQEIEKTLQKGADLDLCPIMRFVLLWMPLGTIAMIEVALIIAVPIWFMASTAVSPSTERVTLIGYGTLAIGGVVLLFIAIIAAVHAGVALWTRLSPAKPEVKSATAPKASSAATIAKMGPIVASWARAQHDRFCIRLKVA